MKKQELKDKIADLIVYYFEEIEEPQYTVILDALKEIRTEYLKYLIKELKKN